jgi:hypothetical protein
LACSIETREPKRTDVPLVKITTPSLLNSPVPSKSHEAKPTPNSLNVSTAQSTYHTPIPTTAFLQCNNPPFRLTSTWVPPSVLKTFTEAFEKEIAIQAEPMALSLAARRSGSNALLRNLGLELLVLYAKRGRAEAEGEVYVVAIEHCCGWI